MHGMLRQAVLVPAAAWPPSCISPVPCRIDEKVGTCPGLNIYVCFGLLWNFVGCRAAIPEELKSSLGG